VHADVVTEMYPVFIIDRKLNTQERKTTVPLDPRK
jgi:hypothetical protein